MSWRPRPLRPERVRHLERPFSWIPFRILSSGLLGELSPAAKLLYFFLCLVSDRMGLSFYGEKRLSELIALSPSRLAQARAELAERDLLAFDGRVYQLLSLPTSPKPPPPRPSVAGCTDEAQSVGMIIRKLSRED